MSVLPPAFAVLALVGGPAIDPAPHLDWAEGIAKRRARRYGVRKGSSEEDLVVAEAQLTVCQLARRFKPSLVPPLGDPAGQFRGWSLRPVLTAADRECRRLRNAGLWNASSRPKAMRCVAFSQLSTPIREPEAPPPEPEEWSVSDVGDESERVAGIELSPFIRQGKSPNGRRVFRSTRGLGG